MNKINLLILFLLLLSVISVDAQNNCQPVTDLETTYWSDGGFKSGVDGEGTVLKRAKGKIIDNDGKPVKGVLIEMFAAPGWRRPLVGPEYQKQRVVACKTGSNGKFYFPVLADGRYDLILSKKDSLTMAWLVTINSNTRRKGSSKYRILY